ncbi:hypothetical protein Tco_0961965 [Tanacetum coccineum]
MVRSMMNLKTLSLSFRDYALESATRILNMVPTKKVDKTPYELWYGKTEEHSLGDLNEHTSYKAAMLDPESKWLDAMNAEMQSMIDNNVWVLIDLSPNCKTVESKVDYEETFSPIAEIKAIRILMSIATFYD